jgi:PE-PPE domain
MNSTLRSLGVVGFVIACVFTLGWSTPLATLVQLLGTTAMIMGGTQHPLINPSDQLPDVDGQQTYGFSENGLDGVDGIPAGYVGDALTKYIRGAGPVDERYNVMAVWTPEAFWPIFGSQTLDASVRTGLGNLDLCVHGDACIAHLYPNGEGGTTDIYSVFAYSQSALIASLEKARVIKEYDPADPDTVHHVTFVMNGNPNRPNGGILQRLKGVYIPILEVSFDGSTPTNSPVVDGEFLNPTADVARQYDGLTDFPLYPLNLLADVNALAGIAYLHSDYFIGDAANPVAGRPYLFQGQVGDTNYYLLASKRLPILLPLAAIGVPDPVLTALDAPLRVLIEWGYNRDISPGVPMSAQVFRLSDPIANMVHLAVATLTGLDDGISEAAGDPGDRPFGTKPVESTFGVGGKVLPTTMVPVAPTSPPVQPPALAARVAPSLEKDAAEPGASRPVVDSDPAPNSDPVTDSDPPKADPPKADDHVSDPAVKTDVTGSVPPQEDAPKPDPREAAARPDARSGTEETNGDNAPMKAKHRKTGLHLVTRHDRHASARTVTQSVTGSETAAAVTTGPRQRMEHGKDAKSIGGHPDSASAAAGSSADSDE